MTYANGIVYQGTIDGTVHALSAADGRELWSDTPGGGIGGGFSVSKGTLYAGRGFWFAAPPAMPNGGLVAYSVSSNRWVGTWSASPLCFFAATLLGLPQETKFENQSVRMIVHTSVGGDGVRVRLTNGCGSDPLQIGAASVGIRDVGPRILPGTDRVLKFGGRRSVAIPAGAERIDGKGLSVFPGMIDAGTNLGLAEIGQGANATMDVAETGSMNANAKAILGVNPHSSHVNVTRVNGITTVLSQPSGGLIAGRLL